MEMEAESGQAPVGGFLGDGGGRSGDEEKRRPAADKHGRKGGKGETWEPRRVRPEVEDGLQPGRDKTRYTSHVGGPSQNIAIRTRGERSTRGIGRRYPPEE
jgi:hypothetical protein